MYTDDVIRKKIKASFHQTGLYHKIDRFRWRERSVCRGKNYPDEHFYVIRRHASRAGLFSFVMTNLGSIREAIDRGMVPIIDMESSINPLILPEEVSRVNGWERYFLQPCGFSLSDVSQARHITLSDIRPPACYPDAAQLRDPEMLRKWRKLFHQYIHVKPELLQQAESYIAEQFPGKKVLGVLARGTDYRASKPHAHEIQPDAELLIRDAGRMMRDKGYGLIYLATEDGEIWDAFQAAFPGKCLSFQKDHFTVKEGEWINDLANEAVGTMTVNREYLISIVILSRCQGFLGGAANGSFGALLMSDGYEDQVLYDLGVYP